MATLGGQLTRSVASYADQIALVFGDRERTYRELDAEVNRHAHALIELGVAKGDRVALMSSNSDLEHIPMEVSALRLRASRRR